MIRDKEWTDKEVGNLARAWVYKTEDSFTGTGQTDKIFKEKIFERLKVFASD